MIKFEKVSYNQFAKDMKKFWPNISEEYIKKSYDSIKLPARSTHGSAGYDFFSPIDFKLYPENYALGKDKNSEVIPTGIRWVVDNVEQVALLIYPRSGMGFKYGVKLANTTGVIDRDYHLSDNEGHILIKLNAEFDTALIEAGKAFVQGVILPFYTTTDEPLINTVRNGGLGSTDKK